MVRRKTEIALLRSETVLEIATFPVDDLTSGSERTPFEGIVSVNIPELRELLLQDSNFDDVSIDIVKPGDDARVIHVLDVVEPRVRISEPGTDFPGLLAHPQSVGSGLTHRMSGVAVVAASGPVPGETTYWREAIIDMSGEGARYSPFSKLINLVLTFRPNLEKFPVEDALGNPQNLFGGTSKAIEYNLSARLAALKASVYLAESTRSCHSESVERYQLKSIADSGLPKIVYVMQALPYIYGEITPGVVGHAEAGVLPTIIHPNEILDGALVNSFNPPACMREATWMFQNHALIQDLFKRHGKDLEFAGVVLHSYADSAPAKERSAYYAANLAHLLKADGAILTSLGGGHPTIDVMMACEKLEKQGIKTTLLLMEMAANPGDSGFIHYVNEADAILSTGNYEEEITVPAMQKVLGGKNIFTNDRDASKEMKLTLRHFIGSTGQFGHGHLRGQEY